MIANADCTLKKCHFCRVVAIVKCVLADVRNAAGYRNMHQSMAPSECLFSDANNAIRDQYVFEFFTGIKRISIDGCNAVRDYYACHDGIRILKDRSFTVSKYSYRQTANRCRNRDSAILTNILFDDDSSVTLHSILVTTIFGIRERWKRLGCYRRCDLFGKLVLRSVIIFSILCSRQYAKANYDLTLLVDDAVFRAFANESQVADKIFSITPFWFANNVSRMIYVARLVLSLYNKQTIKHFPHQGIGEICNVIPFGFGNYISICINDTHVSIFPDNREAAVEIC